MEYPTHNLMTETDRKRFLEAMTQYGDRHFDPALGMLRLPMETYRNVHTEHLDDTARHPLRESIYYALVLLEMADRSMHGRAQRIIGEILALQETADPDARTFGLWPYFQEEPVGRSPWPDFNWADFIAMPLALLWHRHRRHLAPELREAMVRAIHRAAQCIRRRDVDLHYTNIAIKGIFVTLAAAEITGDSGLLDYAAGRLSRLCERVEAAGTVNEYNSPAYASLSLAGLHAVETYIRHGAARQKARSLIKRLWDQIARRFHPATRELAGPHARAYHLRFSERPGLLGLLMERATEGALRFGDRQNAFGPLYALVMNVKIPKTARRLLAGSSLKPRQEIVSAGHYPGEAPRVLTTYLEEAFCLGSVSFQDGWEQRHNLIAYWPAANGVAVLRHRYLHDERPCCSGYLASRQNANTVTAAGFLGAYADHHVSVPVEAVEAAFLGVVIDLDAPGENPGVRVDGRTLAENASHPLETGSRVEVKFAAVTLEWTLLHHEVRPGPAPSPRVQREGRERLRIILPHHEGARRTLRWSNFGQAASTYRLQIRAATAPPPTAPAQEEALFPSCLLPRADLERWAAETFPAPRKASRPSRSRRAVRAAAVCLIWLLALITPASADFTNEMIARWDFENGDDQPWTDEVSGKPMERRGLGADQTVEREANGLLKLGKGTLLFSRAVNSAEHPELTHGITLWARVRFHEKPDAAFLFGLMATAQPGDWKDQTLIVRSLGEGKSGLGFFGQTQSGGELTNGSALLPIPPDTVMNIALVYDGGRRRVTLYVNGEEISRHDPKWTPPLRDFEAVAVGRLNQHGRAALSIRELRVYSVPLSREWINEIGAD